MSENPRAGAAARSGSASGGNIFQRFGLFLSQIMAELRKVVVPTREQLFSYTMVVVAFVLIMMFYVFGLDQLFTRLVAWAFGNG